MEQLHQYLKSLSSVDRDRYAMSCGTSANYLFKAIYKDQRFDGALARLLDENSKGLVKKEHLRPDIWPELLATDAA